MHKKHYSFLFSIVFCASALLVPQRIFAAQVTFSEIQNGTQSGNTKTVDVRIDPQAAKLNVVEGTISLESAAGDKLSVTISTDRSVLSIWPLGPEFDPVSNTIHFTGGVPDGFNTEGLLFRLRISSPSLSDVGISWLNGTSYLNDGKGTAVAIDARPIVVYGTPIKEPSGGGEHWYALPAPPWGIAVVGLLLLIIGLACIYGYKKNHKK